jgi:hypothetical protein
MLSMFEAPPPGLRVEGDCGGFTVLSRKPRAGGLYAPRKKVENRQMTPCRFGNSRRSPGRIRGESFEAVAALSSDKR